MTFWGAGNPVTGILADVRPKASHWKMERFVFSEGLFHLEIHCSKGWAGLLPAVVYCVTSGKHTTTKCLPLSLPVMFLIHLLIRQEIKMAWRYLNHRPQNSNFTRFHLSKQPDFCRFSSSQNSLDLQVSNSQNNLVFFACFYPLKVVLIWPSWSAGPYKQ